MMKSTLVLLAALALSVGSLQATAITVPNFSFENDTTVINDYLGSPESYINVGAISDWTWVGDAGAELLMANNSEPGTGDGVIVYETYGSGAATLTSAAALTTAKAGYDYDLTVAVGQWGTPGTMTIAILVDDVVKASQSVDMTTLTYALTDLSVSYTAVAGDAGKDVKVQLGSTPDGTIDALFDNVRLNEVPEPATLTLLGLGAVALRLRRKR